MFPIPSCLIRGCRSLDYVILRNQIVSKTVTLTHNPMYNVHCSTYNHMYNVQCTMYDAQSHVQCTMYHPQYHVQCTMYHAQSHVQCTLFDVQYHVQCTVYDAQSHVQCTLFDVQYHVQCTMFIVHCTMCVSNSIFDTEVYVVDVIYNIHSMEKILDDGSMVLDTHTYIYI